MHYYGEACEQDYEKAVRFYKEASEKASEEETLSRALLSLGMMYHFGKGVRQDLEIA